MGRASRRHWRPRAAGCWCPGCAAMARPGSSTATRRARASRPLSAPICTISWTRSASRTPFSPAMIGAVAPPASSRPCGRSECAGWSRSAATTSRTSPYRGHPAAGGAGASAVVPVVLPDRARPRRARGQPPRPCAPVVAAVVAELAFRRRDFRGHRGELRQPRFCRGDDPVLSPSPRQRRRATRQLEPIEQRLAAQPPITVPTIVLHGAADGVSPPAQSEHRPHQFAGPYDRRVIPVAGHFLSRETPEAVVQALRDLIQGPR